MVDQTHLTDKEPCFSFDSKYLRQSQVCTELVSHAWDVCKKGKAVDQELTHILRTRRELGSRDRRLIQNVVFASFRWWGWTRALGSPTTRMLLSYLLDGNPWVPVCELWASQAKLATLAEGSQLEGSLEEKRLWLQSYLNLSSVDLSFKSLLPDWSVAEFSELLTSAPQEALFPFIESLQTKPALWIRLQSKNKAKVLEEFQQKKIGYSFHDSLSQALRLHQKTNFHELQSFEKGQFEIQDLASQCVSLICDPKPEEQWWDVCAGAGGKSLHLAALMRNQGKVLATDIRTHSLEELHKRAKRGNLKEFRSYAWDGEKLPFEKNLLFEGVLVDAPCSGTGTWKRNPDQRWRTSLQDVLEYTKLQTKILQIASQQVKPEGKLVYATCSLMKKENNEIIHTFLKHHSNFQPLACAHPLSGTLIEEGLLTLWPQQHNSDGMFIASLQRIS
ncbi:RsmB/NOP family class I SAM-dependent RNA methyltransferase [Deltaproteobacteria bacterium TL4]